MFHPFRSLLIKCKKRINLKFRFIDEYGGKSTFKILDIGAGNHSASRIKNIFPLCKYYGLDNSKSYANDEGDFQQMEHFYELDLTQLNYSVIPDEQFDLILMTHVIEHLPNGDQVIPGLLKKLKPGGHMYIEYPGKKSTRLPSMYGTLNFYDDPTHVRIYSVKELKKIFEENDCRIISSGTRRNIYYIIAMPLRIILSLIHTGRLQGNLFWDLLGFAEFLKVQKRQ